MGWALVLLAAALLGGCAGDGSNAVVGGGTGLVAIQNTIFSPTCAMMGCHDALTQAGELNLSTAADAFDQLVGAESTCAGRVHVVAGDSASSYLLDKLGDGAAPCGDLMPLGLSALSDDELALIRDWIDDGAPPPDEPGAVHATASTSTTTVARRPRVVIVP